MSEAANAAYNVVTMIINIGSCKNVTAILCEVQGQAKERELSLVREVTSGQIGSASAAPSKWVVGRREIQTGDFSFAQACTKPPQLNF